MRLTHIATLALIGTLAQSAFTQPVLAQSAAEQSRTLCTALASVSIDNVRIDSSEVIAAGAFTPPGASTAQNNSIQSNPFQRLPAFCRVAATLTPSSDSDIKMELWLPLEAWNDKYQAVGNGAFLGSIAYPSLGSALARGYAASSTDTGHVGNTGSFGYQHPEKVIDFGWRSLDAMTVTAKALIAAFYQAAPQYSYWNGCSAGGRQAMQIAQRFPDHFDGIIAGAPGLDWTGRAAAALRVAQVLEADPAAQLNEQHRSLLHSAALKACDADDGVVDGIIGKPQQCAFDPAVLQCTTAATDTCLTATQIETVHLLYSSPLNPATGRAITGLLPGSETGWSDLGWTASARATGLDQFRYLVKADPEWSIAQFEFATDIAAAEGADQNTVNALNADLRPFIASGGKLIQYHGWSDPQISPANSTQYYERVIDVVGSREALHDSYRLFMAPGMGHCAGGAGPNTFDMIDALENWVEQGEAPDSILASHSSNGSIDMTRPLCPFPEVAVYNGNGNSSGAENFSCAIVE